MAKISSLAAKLALQFNQSEDYTDAMLKKHSVTSLPSLRQPGDGLDAFYSDMSGSYNDQPSMTKQEFTESCDPNVIVDRHARGLDISSAFKQGMYGNFTNLPTSYHEALNIVTVAKQSFMQLDAKTRTKFDNDPGKFSEWLSNPAFQQEHIEMGFAVAKPDESPATASAPAPAPAASDGGGEGA